MIRSFQKGIACSGLCFLASGCFSSTSSEGGKQFNVIDLSKRFVQVLPAFERARTRESESFYPNQSITRCGRRQDALVLVAPVTVAVPLANLSGTVRLQALAAPLFNVGDGLEMAVILSDGRERRPAYQRYFDPGRRASDRDWILLDIPLELDPRRQWRVEVQVSAGPQGDLVADWLALSRVRLVRRESE